MKVPLYIVSLAKELRRKQTPAEEIIWACLRSRRLTNAKFRRQHPLGRYIADFYCHDARLAIELEGGVHRQRGQIEYDEERETLIRQQGVRILKFNNKRIIEDLDRVLQEIEEALTRTE